VDLLYELGDPETQHVRRFNTTAETYPLNFQNTEHADNFHDQLPAIFDHAIERIIEGTNETDYIGAELIHPDLHAPVLIPFRHPDEIQGSQLLHILERVLQSNEHLNINDYQLKVRIVKVSPPCGKGYHSRQCTNLDKLREIKKSIVRITNTDDLCLARAITVAKARLEHLAAPQNKKLFRLYQNLSRGDKPPRKQQFNAAKALMKAAGLETHKGACGIPEIQAIQDILPDYQIRIFNTLATAGLVYSGPPADNIIYLYNHDNHYDVITTMEGFFNRGYYCKDCNIAYCNKEKHQCSRTCPCCHESPACPDVQYKDSIKCPTCNRYFRGQTCLQNHTKHTERKIKDKTVTFPSICDRLQCCKDCGKHLSGVKNIGEHKCHHFKCRTCNEIVPIQDHLCYMQPLDPKKELVECEVEEVEEEDEAGEDLGYSDNEEEEEKEEREKPPTKFVFYDFETRQETTTSTNDYGKIVAHEPNLCVAHTVCELCMDKPLGTFNNCGPNRHVFSGANTADEFCDYLFGLKHVTAFAHNAKDSMDISSSNTSENRTCHPKS